MNISDVVRARKCISCGACASSCPAHAIAMKYNIKSGFYRPVISKELCVNCGKCQMTCPAENWTLSDSLIGHYENLMLAHASDQIVRHNATSGGVVNALARYLISHKIVESVLMVRYSCESPIESAAYAIDSDNIDLLEKRARDFSSRYVSVPLLSVLKAYEEKYRTIAIVGTPCQIKAVNLLIAKHVMRFDRIIKIGIACSGGMSYLATKEYKRRQKTVEAKMYYRGDGWPGKNCLISANRTIESSHLGSMFERMFSSQIFKNPGCHFCTDQFAEEADISFCDFWNAEERKSEHEGNSCVIVRNAFLGKVIADMESEGYIHKVRNLCEQEIIQTQRSVLNAKKGDVRMRLYYKLFHYSVDMIFRLKLYKLFGVKSYQKICRLYARICMRGGVDITKS